jgi:hypothetical protein
MATSLARLWPGDWRDPGLLGEDLVDELDTDRALADGGSDALDAGGADVADSEHAGHAGLEQVGRTGQRPGGKVVRGQVGASLDEALVVEGRSNRAAIRCWATRRSS